MLQAIQISLFIQEEEEEEEGVKKVSGMMTTLCGGSSCSSLTAFHGKGHQQCTDQP